MEKLLVESISSFNGPYAGQIQIIYNTPIEAIQKHNYKCEIYPTNNSFQYNTPIGMTTA